MTHPDQDIIDFLTKDLDLRAAPDWMIERARAFRDGWRLIESAPKDGTRVLLGDIGWAAVWTGYFRTERQVGMKEWREDQVIGWTRDGAMDISLNPTHWRPLPNPPKDTEQ